MKNLLIALISLVAVSGAAFAQDAPAVKPTPAAPKPVQKVAAIPAKAVCPITKEEFKPTTASDKSTYAGKTYYFCCAGCKPQFDKAPSKYVTAAKPAPATKKPAAKPAPAKKTS